MVGFGGAPTDRASCPDPAGRDRRRGPRCISAMAILVRFVGVRSRHRHTGSTGGELHRKEQTRGRTVVGRSRAQHSGGGCTRTPATPAWPPRACTGPASNHHGAPATQRPDPARGKPVLDARSSEPPEGARNSRPAGQPHVDRRGSSGLERVAACAAGGGIVSRKREKLFPPQLATTWGHHGASSPAGG
jgi:hypothetical protein